MVGSRRSEGAEVLEAVVSGQWSVLGSAFALPFLLFKSLPTIGCGSIMSGPRTSFPRSFPFLWRSWTQSSAYGTSPHLRLREHMNKLLAILMCFAVPIALVAADNSYKVTYDGGSLTDQKAGTGMKLYIDTNQIRLMKDKTDVVTIPATAVTEISYGQDVHRRVGAAIGLAVVSLGIGALMALTKSKKHYVGLTWADGDKKGGFAMQCDKNDYRGVLAGLEGVTGKKAVDSDAMTVKN